MLLGVGSDDLHILDLLFKNGNSFSLAEVLFKSQISGGKGVLEFNDGEGPCEIPNDSGHEECKGAEPPHIGDAEYAYGDTYVKDDHSDSDEDNCGGGFSLHGEFRIIGSIYGAIDLFTAMCSFCHITNRANVRLS